MKAESAYPPAGGMEPSVPRMRVEAEAVRLIACQPACSAAEACRTISKVNVAHSIRPSLPGFPGGAIPVRASSAPRLVLAAWLLATNLSLGLYHQHGADDAEHASASRMPHRAAPESWHYHLLFCGFELDCLSQNCETCPFGPETPAQGESQVMLSGSFGLRAEHEPDADFGLLLACAALGRPTGVLTAADPCSALAAADCEPDGPPALPIALRARSGVLQV